MAEALLGRLLIDERLGRAVARGRGLTIVETVAVLVAARRRELIPPLAALFERLAAAGYHLAPALGDMALTQVGERLS